jgi:hypothetical protein
LQPETSAFIDKGYVSGTVFSFSTRTPSTRASSGVRRSFVFMCSSEGIAGKQETVDYRLGNRPIIAAAAQALRQRAYRMPDDVPCSGRCDGGARTLIVV